MSCYTPVEVITAPDENGQLLPKQIICSNNRTYSIKRILHICQPEDMVVRYTVLVGKEQRHLFFNGKNWCVSRHSTGADVLKQLIYS